MRYIVVVFFLFYAKGFSQELISWRQQPLLTWSDFRGKSADETLAAVTYCSIDTKIAVKGEVLSIVVDAVFYPDSSWYNTSKIHNLTLQHEQGHFDIAEWYARKLRKLIAVEIKTVEDYKNSFHKKYEALHQEYIDMQAMYDEETIHGTIEINQNNWSTEITAGIAELKEYAE